MNIKEQVQKMDAVVSTGAVVDAVKQFFADSALFQEKLLSLANQNNF